MSLIHDSLRKLEAKQVGELDGKISETSDLNQKLSLFSAKNLWVLTTLAVGVTVIIYTYITLSNYQKQNEILLQNIMSIKSQNAQLNSSAVRQVSQPVQRNKFDSKKQLVNTEQKVRDPAVYNKTETAKKVVVQKPMPINAFELTDKVVVAQKPNRSNLDLKIIEQKSSNTKKKSPTDVTRKNKSRRIINKSKLSIKQTRQLVNNLQLSIESGNYEKVEELLAILAKSSGENSLVYLRMNAYYLTKTDDDVMAVEVYKKILYQNSYDKQAVINLALLEAKNGQLTSALTRLKELKIRYPSDKNIEMYLTRLKVN